MLPQCDGPQVPTAVRKTDIEGLQQCSACSVHSGQSRLIFRCIWSIFPLKTHAHDACLWTWSESSASNTTGAILFLCILAKAVNYSPKPAQAENVMAPFHLAWYCLVRCNHLPIQHQPRTCSVFHMPGTDQCSWRLQRWKCCNVTKTIFMIKLVLAQTSQQKQGSMENAQIAIFLLVFLLRMFSMHWARLRRKTGNAP